MRGTVAAGVVTVLMNVSDDQQVLVLRAMREIATAGGTTALTERDRAALVAASAYVFRRPDPLDPDRLDPVTPTELAAGLPDAADADHAAQFLAVMALVDGTVDGTKIELVERFAAALGLDEDYLRQLAALAHDKLKWLIADVQRQNLHSITGGEVEMPLDQWILPYQEQPDPDLAARYHALGDLPEETFGRTFADFYHDNGFAFPGEPDGVNADFATPHDSTHLLSGYDTSPQGELLVSTFTGGMHRQEAMSGHILPVIITWHLGVELVHFAGKHSGALDPEKFWVAWERGSEVTTDVFATQWDFWAQAARPLADVRAECAVPPLDVRHAAGGEIPDWYTPSA